jgi:hypothetical protein
MTHQERGSLPAFLPVKAHTVALLHEGHFVSVSTAPRGACEVAHRTKSADLGNLSG